jgi:predicted ATPase
MLTRLKVNGFKNLVDVDVYFGPFTCVAGANAVGKSNLFDAIHFLRAIADRPLIEAALSIRAGGGRNTDVRSLFHRVGDDFDPEMSFVAEMIIPQEGWDDLGQKAEATMTFLEYSVTIAYRMEEYGSGPLGSLELKKEELIRITKGEAHKKLLFEHNTKWRYSAVKGRRVSPYISTEGDGENRVIIQHQDGKGGRTLKRPAVNLPRTVLSVANAAESPTALMAKREMQSWRLLQLEPSALREPDSFTAPIKLGMDGSHLAATLYSLARRGGRKKGAAFVAPGRESITYGQIANRLSGLIDDVYEVSIDPDEKREILTLYVTDNGKTPHPARALSDGTLRFLALAVMELDPETEGLLCLEEPENGIHPERIPAMLRLLKDIAVDTIIEIGTETDNPLRQVIINTHSPAVVAQVDDDELLVAELKEDVRSGKRFKKACFSCLPETWRSRNPEASIVSKGKLLSYLNPIVPQESTEMPKKRRVADREDLRQMIMPFAEKLSG